MWLVTFGDVLPGLLINGYLDNIIEHNGNYKNKINVKKVFLTRKDLNLDYLHHAPNALRLALSDPVYTWTRSSKLKSCMKMLCHLSFYHTVLNFWFSGSGLYI